LGGYFVDAGGEVVEADFGDGAGCVFCWCHFGDVGVVLCVKVDDWDWVVRVEYEEDGR
jgi:hypothetical protein